MTEKVTLRGQYGKQNPLFMYQGTGGASMETALQLRAETQAYNASPKQAGTEPHTATSGYTAAGRNTARCGGKLSTPRR